MKSLACLWVSLLLTLPAFSAGQEFIRQAGPEFHDHVKFRRHREAGLDPALFSALDHAASKPKIHFQLFDDLGVDVQMERHLFQGAGSRVVMGSLASHPGGHMVASVRDGILTAFFFVPKKGYYSLRYTGQGRYQISEWDSSAPIGCGLDQTAPGTSGMPSSILAAYAGQGSTPPNPSGNTGCPNPLLGLGPLTTIDLLVVYTPAALATLGSGNLMGFIDSEVAEANLAMQNDLLPVQFRLVHVEQVAFTESANIITDFGRLTVTAAAPSLYATVQGLRTAWGADLACVVEQIPASPAAAGIARLKDAFLSVSPSVADTDAFSMIYDDANPCLLAHELGHNFGCDHDGNSLPSPRNGFFLHSLAWGSHFTAADGTPYRDIMAYGNLDNSIQVPYYSSNNPQVLFEGLFTGGSAVGTYVQAGDTCDNAQVISMTAQDLSNYRPTTVNINTAVSLAYPGDNSSFNAGDTVNLAAMASDPGGIQSVQFYLDNCLLGTGTFALGQYTLDSGPLPAGSHVLTAIAVNFDGASTLSCPAVHLNASQTIPLPWLDADINGQCPGGSATYNGATLTVAGGGDGALSWPDTFHWVYQEICGTNATITAQLSSITPLSGYSDAGVMMRQNQGQLSPFVAVLFSNNNNVPIVTMNYRAAAGKVNATAVSPHAFTQWPVWLRLAKLGTSYSGFFSYDGNTWTQFGTVTVPISGNWLAGAFDADGSMKDVGDLTYKTLIYGSATFMNLNFTQDQACPSATPTFTPSSTPVVSLTSSPTSTPSRTPSRTATPTATCSASPSNTASDTTTPSPSFTLSFSATITQTPTITNTFSFSPFYTNSLTFTPDPSTSAQPSQTNTPTPTASPTPSVLPAATPVPHASSGSLVQAIPIPNPCDGNNLVFAIQLSGRVSNITLKLYTEAMNCSLKREQSGSNFRPGWNKLEIQNANLAPGLYFALVKAGNASRIARVIVVK